MLQAAHFLLKSYNSWVHKWEWLPHYHQAKEKMNHNYSFLLFFFLINVCVFPFFFLKVVERYLGHVTKSPIIYINFFFYNKPVFIKNNKIEIVQPRASFMITYIIWSSKATIYKTIPIVNKAPLSKLMNYLIYIPPNPNETWSISFAKSSTSSSIVLRLLLMCGCSSSAICYWNLFSMIAIINKQF